MKHATGSAIDILFFIWYNVDTLVERKFLKNYEILFLGKIKIPKV